MKLCFVIGNLSYSGAEKILYKLITELNNRHYEISIVLLSCTEKNNSLPNEIFQFPLFDLAEEQIKNKFVRVKKRQERIKKIIDNNNFDLVISFGVKFNIDVAEACKNNNVNLVLCERNDPIYDPKSKLLRLRRSISYKRANGFVFQTEEIKKFFSLKIQKRSVIIPNFIDKKNDNEYINSKHRNSFITCARLDNNQKSQIFLIKTFSKFLKKYPQYKLEFIGDGPDKERYINLVNKLGVRDNVIFHGKIKNPIKKLSKCKCFILTSKYEGMPNALIEALSVGMPCISTNCSGGGAKFLINDKENGILVKRNSTKQLLKAMESIASNNIDLSKMSKKAHNINEKLDIKKVVNNWEEFIINMKK